MNWQLLIVMGIVALAVGYLGRVLWRSTRGCTGCGCSAGQKGKTSSAVQITLIPVDQLRLRSTEEGDVKRAGSGIRETSDAVGGTRQR
jgi:hypothetical protein